MWRNTDPRNFIHNTISKIVLIYPDVDNKGRPKDGMTYYYVDTKDRWNIFPDTDNINFIGPKDSWHKAWFWTLAPGE